MARDERGASYFEYLLITGAIALGLAASSATLRDGLADALIQRSHHVLGVDP